ncbi:E6 protein [Bos taurus papillomavirus 18]|uniref:Protein E6 n=1 Tax=Bos taurus papillomavirus 18 TaxID=1887216 RepID=A0A1B2K215_9PAPI|nr:E6 protein [Bos taurus papillomavirus 18]ANZ90244.1 E6 protein [Bos taurus papillomavirus 18]
MCIKTAVFRETQMASQPKTITELIESLSPSDEAVYLKCVFCRGDLTISDCTHFEEADLQLIWKRGEPYGACKRCCIHAGYLECSTKYMFSMFGVDVEIYTGRRLLCMKVRCYRCFKPLNFLEKIKQVERYEPFHCISYRWKGRCLKCKHDWDELHSS